MQDYQKNREFPLADQQWARLNRAVVEEARRTLVARRFISVYGPLGAGLESVSFETYGPDELAEIDLVGRVDPSPIGPKEEKYVRVPIIYKDFILHWRDVELSKKLSSPLDASRAIRAAHFVADKEDDLIFNGEPRWDIEGIMNCRGRNSIKAKDWATFGNAFDDVQRATEKLLEDNHHRPFALVLSPQLYASLLKVKEPGAVLELDQITKLCNDAVYQTSVLRPNQAVLVSTGDENFDIAVTEDLNLAYLGPRDMDYPFRVYEALVLRIKRPTAICTLEFEG